MDKRKKLRIGIIDPADYSGKQSFGGSSGFIKNILPYFESHDVNIYGIGINGTGIWKRHRLKNAVFFQLANLTFPSKIPMRLKVLYVYIKYRKLILNSKLDVLYVHSPEICLPFLFKNIKTPVVYHQHGSGNPVQFSKFPYGNAKIFMVIFHFFNKLIHKKADWIIAIDKLCLRQVTINGGRQKATLLLNAVDRRRYYPDEHIRLFVRKKFKLKDNTCTILCAGRIEKNKGFQYVIDCLPTLKLSGLHFNVFFAGDGTYRSALEKMVKYHGLTSNVIFLGIIPHEEISNFYLMSDILILTSDMEGIPMVIIEALACGTPTVAYNVGGIPLLIKEGRNGKLIEDRRPETIADSIVEVYQRKYSRTDVAKTIESLGAEKAAAILEKIFIKLRT